MLLKMSNHGIQVIFPEGNGFLFNTHAHSLRYFAVLAKIEEDVEIPTSWIMNIEKENVSDLHKLQEKLKIKDRTILMKKLIYIKGIIDEVGAKKIN